MEPSLFDLNTKETKSAEKLVHGMPLAARLRPSSFDEFIGQKHILSDGKLLKRSIESDSFSSILLYGPSGVGKTSLAELIAKVTNAKFVRLSGITLKVADLRKEITEAIFRKEVNGERTIIFIDEIHRFNRAQQDSLLPDIENGNIRFIGATTQNPYFYIISPLLSRSLVFRLELLSKDEIMALISRAVVDERGFGSKKISISDDAIHFWSEKCEGDARRALNALEAAVLTSVPKDGNIKIDLSAAEASIQQKSINYGKDEHYDTISAFIKSMRGSSPDAALYWLAKMLKAGEDIMFIARRIVIFASEDIGNADPQAIQVAVTAMQAVEMIGMPEARIILAQATTYCATAPKSNASYMGISEAIDDVENDRIQPVPIYLRSKYCSGTNEEEHDGYKYPHDYKEHYVKQSYLGVKKIYYKPTEFGYERKIKERLNYWKSLEEI